jgi:hypothetical protein
MPLAHISPKNQNQYRQGCYCISYEKLDVNLSPYLTLLTFSFFFGREKNVNTKNFS